MEVTDAQDYDRRADKPWTKLTPADKVLAAFATGCTINKVSTAPPSMLCLQPCGFFIFSYTVLFERDERRVSFFQVL